MIFAALRGVPFAALPYASKVTGLLEDLKIATPPLGKVGIGQLIARVDRGWDTRDQLRRAVGERIPELKERSRQNNALLLQLLGRQANLREYAPAATQH